MLYNGILLFTQVQVKSLSHVRLFATPWTNLPGSSVLGIFQAKILEWVAISFSRGSSQPRDWTRISHIAGRCFTIWATGKLFTHPVCNSLPLLKPQTPVDGHLDCFHFLATISRLSVSIYQRALLPTDSSLQPFREALVYPRCNPDLTLPHGSHSAVGHPLTVKMSHVSAWTGNLIWAMSISIASSTIPEGSV